MTTPHTPPAGTGEDGTSTVELALVFPVFFLVIWGMVVYGMVFQTSHTLDAAASEAARAAVGVRDGAAAEALARDTAVAQLSPLGAHAGNAAVSVSPPAACPTIPGANCLTVTISYPWDAAPVIPHGPLGGTMTPDTLTASSTIQLSE